MKKLFHNAKIFTHSDQWANYFVVENDTIVSIGSDKIDISNFDESFDLQGNYVFPGFCDEHIHIWKVGNLMTYMLDVRGVSSLQEMMVKIQEFIDSNPANQWYVIRGFNEINFENKTLPTAEDLDQLNTKKPVFVIRSCAHIGIANTKAMQIAGVLNGEVKIPQGGEMRLDNDGNPNGIFTETALGLIMNHIPKFTYEEYKNMIEKAQNLLLSFGITAATDPAVHPELLEAYHKMNKKGLLKIRINAIPIRLPDGESNALPLPKKYYSDFLVVDTVKFFADGGLSGKTAAMSKPYKNSDYTGVLRLNYDSFLPLAKESYEAGFKIATHAIGDVAVDTCLKVYSEIQQENSFPNRIEHLGFLTEENAEIMKKLGTVAVMQPIFIKELGNNFTDALEQERLEEIYPLQSVLNHRIPLALSTDGPVVKELDPLIGIEIAQNRQTQNQKTIGENQKITQKEAVLHYFSNEILNKTFKNSKLEIGFKADFNVFNTNILEENKEQPTLLQTYINGKLIFNQ